MSNSFFALVLRMKFIERWGLMRNTFHDNLAEHSLDTAVFSHALCTIGNQRLGKQLDGERCALLAIFHDVCEIITGDMPTPVKYSSEAMHSLYKEVEREAADGLLRHLPEDMQPIYRELIVPSEQDRELLSYVKAADKLSAYVKCVQEVNGGNREFENARRCQLDALNEMDLPEVRIFLQEFIPPFSESLDQQQQIS